jgi:RNA polymerase sigma factor (sigma-70 family)
MTPAAPTTPVATPDEPVRAALADDQVRYDLLVHARAIVNGQLKDRPLLERAEAVETAVNQAACRALEKRSGYDPAQGSVTAWLHGVLNHVLLETARDLRRRPAQPPVDPAAWEQLATALARGRSRLAEDGLDAAEILSRLSPDQRTLLEMRYSEGLEYTAIAAGLGISS